MKTCFRNDARQKVCGTARFADDYSFPRMVHSVPVYSDYVHARITAILVEEAERMPGVLAVQTWKDVPGALTAGQIDQDFPILVKDRIRFNGDVVAIITAETRAEALAAVEKVQVKAKVLPILVDTEEAIKSAAIVIPEGRAGNVVNHHKVRKGNPEKMMAESDIIIEEFFTTPLVEHAYLEPECGICIPRDDGVLEIYGSIQHPFSTRRFVCAYLGRPLASVIVYAHAVGGSFGGKDDTASIVCARAALAAVKLKRPVKMLYDRAWSMKESYKRNPYKMWYKAGFSSEGKLKAVISRTLADSGAYTSTTPWSTWRSAAQNVGPYELADIHADVYGVATNNIFSGAFRGFGSPQTNFAFEQVIDMAADRLGMDPLEIRKLNAVRQNSETITGQVLDDHSVSLIEVMEKTASSIGFKEKRKLCSRGEGDKWYGIGMAASYRGCSLGAEGMDFCCASVNVQFDGSILIDVSVFENGQGAPSAMIILASEILGVPLEDIHYQGSSTASIPDGGTTVASRGTMMGGGALKDALDRLKSILRKSLLPDLAEKEEEIQFRDNRIFGTKGRSISWNEAGKKMYLARVYPYAFGSFQAPKVSWNEENGQGDAYFSYVYSSQAVEVEVDPEKGSWRILNIVASHDIGKAVNPPMVKGQIYGGIVQGLGMALTEDFLTDDEGRAVSLNYSKYKIPRMTDIPEMEAHIIENHDPLSPTGTKGIGEPALEIIAPAIANALAAATGRRFTFLPLNLDSLKKETPIKEPLKK
ncbi:xanthine dehydrogenase family protein molybdopterin-binding subunit [Oceanispirochaeta sp.]|uniref:xanthine dehydrogenase family protein molybdopterin-binding subunit n=1 Tax=Oceanispirochaeta sp. TaxID=2035350 RepID=UPI00262989DB|nr:xanthine dehydrogenase family protein molybdopterin-binding subunit [Oceanispirochaeta sp.]MDA3955741.1 xanthine dehydrogenase family protein molybdopterin-binding subunit [Oceanispirochaeta sp.]